MCDVSLYTLYMARMQHSLDMVPNATNLPPGWHKPLLAFDSLELPEFIKAPYSGWFGRR